MRDLENFEIFYSDCGTPMLEFLFDCRHGHPKLREEIMLQAVTIVKEFLFYHHLELLEMRKVTAFGYNSKLWMSTDAL